MGAGASHNTPMTGRVQLGRLSTSALVRHASAPAPPGVSFQDAQGGFYTPVIWNRGGAACTGVRASRTQVAGTFLPPRSTGRPAVDVALPDRGIERLEIGVEGVLLGRAWGSPSEASHGQTLVDYMTVPKMVPLAATPRRPMPLITLVIAWVALPAPSWPRIGRGHS